MTGLLSLNENLNNAPKSCLSCRLNLQCQKPKKAFNYLCKDYESFKSKKTANKKPTKQIKLEKTPKFEVIKKRGGKVEKRRINDDSDEFQFKTIIKDAIRAEKESPLPRDLRIDDRDLPQAKNFFEFLTSKKFMNIAPFAKQLEIGTNMLAEWCPRCSNPDYIWDVPKRDTPEDFLSEVQLLEWGVCPNCKVTKSELYCEGELDVPWQMVGLAGQRCITGDSLVTTTKGIKSMKEIAALHDNLLGFQRYVGPDLVLENGLCVEASKFFISKKEHCYNVETKNGFSNKGTKDHPLMTQRGWINSSDIKADDAIMLPYGQNIWSCQKLGLRQLYNEYNKIALPWIKGMGKRKNRLVKPQILKKGVVDEKIATLLGFYVSEGSGCQITNADPNVIKFVKKQLRRLYGPNAVNIFEKINPTTNVTTKQIALRGRLAMIHFSLLCDKDNINGSKSKHVPSHIMSGKKTLVAAFLKGLFEGDGSASFKEGISYSSLSKKLVKQVSALLVNFGIPNRIYTNYTWATNGSAEQISKKNWNIAISGKESIVTFKKEIGFFSKRKIDELDNQINKISLINMPWWHEKYPDCIKKEFLDLIERLNVDLNRFRSWSFSAGRYFKKSNRCVRNMFDANSEFRRIYSSNVALSKRRLHAYYNHIINHDNFKHFTPQSKALLHAFYDKYHAKNVVWVAVKQVTVTKKKYTTYDFTIPEHHRFVANGFLNHNSGKSVTSCLIIAYQWHGYLKIPHPLKAFGLLETANLQGTYVALTWKKAKELLFDNITNNVRECKWFQEYHALLDHYQQKTGEKVYNVSDVVASYKHRNMLMYPSGPDNRTLRGSTAFSGAVDEIGMFPVDDVEGKVKMNGEETYNSLSNAFLTVKPAYYRILKKGNYDALLPPLLLNTSSPRSKKDMVCRLLDQSHDDPEMYGWHYSTWEFNPHISKKDLASKFKNNYIAAMRDYGAVPPNSSAPYIENIDDVSDCLNDMVINRYKIKQVYMENGKGLQSIGGDLKIVGQKDHNKRIMALDAGRVNNSFAICLGYFDTNKNIPVFDGLIEIQPTDDLKISFTSVFDDIILPIIDHANVQLLVADRWQGEKFLDDAAAMAENPELMVETHSVKYGDFFSLREDLLNGGIDLPRSETKISKIERLAEDDYPLGFMEKPVAHFLYQLVTVRDNLKDVDKGDGTTDDLLRALVLAYAYLVDPEYQELVSGVTNSVKPQGALLAVGSLGNTYTPMSSFNSGGIVSAGSMGNTSK